MYWAKKIAGQILSKYPNKPVYHCQCGLSTTGNAHFGNYRELAIVYAVARSLTLMGKRAECILSFDDYDRYKKVAPGIPEIYHSYIGMPNFSIPSPFDAQTGFANYYEQKVIDNLEALRIPMRPICQHIYYTDGNYDSELETFLLHRKEIADIENHYKTRVDDKKEYFPVSVYCEKCRKDFTIIREYDSAKKTIRYQCQCGYEATSNLEVLKPKCRFKPDWAMRWKYEEIHFEPSGMSHMEPMGAYAVASEISRRILKHEPPVSLSYRFVDIIGQKGRMSKSSGSIVTLEDALALYGRDMIIWILCHTNPSDVIRISLTENVENLYKEYEKFLASDAAEAIEERVLLEIEDDYSLPFKQICNEVSVWGKSDLELLEYLGENVTPKALDKVKRARFYCDNGGNVKNYHFTGFHIERLTEREHALLRNFCSMILADQPFETIKSEFGDKFKALSKAANLLLFNEEAGPPLKRIMNAYPIKTYMKMYYEQANDNHSET